MMRTQIARDGLVADITAYVPTTNPIIFLRSTLVDFE